MPNLFIDIEARFAQFQDALNAIARQATTSAGQIDKAFGAVKSTLQTLGVAVTLEGMRRFVQGSIDAADHLNDLSKKTGIAVDTLGGLGFAAQQSGGNLDSMVDAVGKLNRSIAEAGAGNAEKAEAFKALGISVKDAAGNLKSGDAIMAALADKFEQYADGPNKVAIAVRLLGKAGADQIPVLNEGGAALQRNIEYYKRYSGVTQDVADRADQFNDTLVKLNLLSGALGTKVASELLGPLQSLADYMLKAKEESKAFETVAGGLKTIFEGLAVIAANVAFVFRGVGTEIGGIAAQTVEWNKAQAQLLAGNLSGAAESFRAFLNIRKEMKSDAAAARKELDEFEARILKLGSYKPTAADLDDAEAGRFRLPRVKGQAPGLADSGAAARAEAARRALDALTDARSKIAVEAEKRSAADRLAVLDHFYKEGFANEEHYWQVRAGIQKAAYDVERRALDENVTSREAALSNAARTKGKDSKEYYDALKDLTEAQAKRNTLDAAFNAQGNTDVLARAKATEDYERAIKNVNIQLEQLKGNTAEAAAAQFDLQNERLKKEAAARGDSKGQSEIDRLRDASAAQATFNELRERATQVTDRLALEEERIQNSQRVGAISEIEALRQTEQARRNALQTLGLTKSQLDQLAQSSGLEKLKLDAEKFGVSLETLASQSNLVSDRYKRVFEDAFGDEFAKVIDGTQKVSEAFKNMGKRIISELANIQARSIAQGLSRAVSGSLGGGGLGALLEGLFGGGKATVTDAFRGDFWSGEYAMGTDYVPRTGLALVHQGEQIIPAGESGRGGVILTQNINVDSRSDIVSVRHAMAVARQEAANVVEDRNRRRAR